MCHKKSEEDLVKGTKNVTPQLLYLNEVKKYLKTLDCFKLPRVQGGSVTIAKEGILEIEKESLKFIQNQVSNHYYYSLLFIIIIIIIIIIVVSHYYSLLLVIIIEIIIIIHHHYY